MGRVDTTNILTAIGLMLTFLLCTAAAYATETPKIACDGSVIDVDRLRRRGASAPERPPEGRLPVPIEIRLEITELSAIDPLSSSFRFEGYGDFRFCDPRLAFDSAAEGQPTRRYLGTNINDPVWNVKLHVANGIGAVEVTQRLIEIQPDGSIRLRGYFNSKVGTGFDLRLFPFDRQSLSIHIESFNYPSTIVRLVTGDEFVSISKDIQTPEWQIEGVRAHVEDASNPREPTPYSRAIVTIDVAREAAFYLFKLWLPLTLIVALSWSVFWMPEESLASRIRISATSFLTVVAYQFAIVGSLPKVSYLTLMDRLMIGSFILIALSGLQSMRADAHRRRGDAARSERLDRRSRGLFPTVYVGWIVTMWVLYGR